MSVINTNYLALVSQSNLTKSQGALGTAIERLSSGLRINSAKDDAAGQAIANRFTANIKGLTQASRNANDGISVAQTTEGALNEINNNLQRIRELSVQAANGSNSDTDLTSIQAEIKQRLDEIDRVSAQTQFNGVKVLASNNTLTVQVGAHDNETIDVNLKEITASTLGLSRLDVGSQITSKGFTAVDTSGNIAAAQSAQTVSLSFPPASDTFTAGVVTSGTSAGQLVVTQGSNSYAATYNADTNTISFNSQTALNATEAATVTSAGTATFVNSGVVVELSELSDAGQLDANTTAAPTVYRQNASANSFFIIEGTAARAVTIDMDTGAVSIGATHATINAASLATTAFTAATGGVLTLPGVDAVAWDTTAAYAQLGGTNSLFRDQDGSYYIKNDTVVDGATTTTYYAATVNNATGLLTAGDEVVVDPLKSIDNALQQVDTLRSDLGAIQNRFQSTIANLSNTVNNLSAARSRIEDADYAVEVSNMTRAQILQQAGTSVLAQANQVPQTVLSLLR